jgi:hypothetical protein
MSNAPPEEEINLVVAKEAINNINKRLEEFNETTGCKYKLDINYFYQMNENAEITAHHELHPKTLLLCAFNNDICVSSIIIDYYEGFITIFSRTKPQYEGNKLNKLLTSVLIIMTRTIHADANYILSEAINPARAYVLMKYFNAKGRDDGIQFSTYKEFSKYIEKHGALEVTIELNDANIENARRVFDKTINELTCVEKKGGKRKRNYLRSKKNKKCRRNRRKTRR